MVVISSTASVSTLTCFSQASLNTSIFSRATWLWGLAARVRAAFITWKETCLSYTKPSWTFMRYLPTNTGLKNPLCLAPIIISGKTNDHRPYNQHFEMRTSKNPPTTPSEKNYQTTEKTCFSANEKDLLAEFFFHPFLNFSLHRSQTMKLFPPLLPY